MIAYSALPPSSLWKKTALAIKTKITFAKVDVKKAHSVLCTRTQGKELFLPAQKEKLHTFIRPGQRSAAAAATRLRVAPHRSGKALIPTTRSKATESGFDAVCV